MYKKSKIKLFFTTLIVFTYANINANVSLATTDSSNVTIPNVFSPNGDNTNDVFKPITKNISELHCTIYNRWGTMVAELKNPNQVWDGRLTSGQETSEGVYYYILTAKGTDGKEFEEEGFVQLLK